MFRATDNLDKAFRSMRVMMLAVVTTSAVVACYALHLYHSFAGKAQERVYVLNSGHAAEVFASTREMNLAVEAKDHIARFHELFFSLDPDEKAIAASIRRALYMVDASAKKQYDDLVESGFIAGIISGNVSQRLRVDSVQVNLTAEPFPFRYYGVLTITRATSVVTRSLVTQGSLRSVARSEHNPHGLLIERWETIENKDLQIQNR